MITFRLLLSFAECNLEIKGAFNSRKSCNQKKKRYYGLRFRNKLRGTVSFSCLFRYSSLLTVRYTGRDINDALFVACLKEKVLWDKWYLHGVCKKKAKKKFFPLSKATLKDKGAKQCLEFCLCETKTSFQLGVYVFWTKKKVQCFFEGIKMLWLVKLYTSSWKCLNEKLCS